jgi:cob(I)alamin adenosyltransferase
VVAVTDPTLAEDAVCLAYMNRLSDLFFVMARVVNRRAGVAEPAWRPRRGA